MKVKVLGILGGSGLYDPSFPGRSHGKTVGTPFGNPSDRLQIGEHGGLRIAFIPRHGSGHTIPPHLVNHRANLWALKNQGVTHIISTSSTGSLKKRIRPGHFVIPDDFISFWNVPTLRDDLHHATPELDAGLRRLLRDAAKSVGATVHFGGTYVQTIGPRLETKAEIRFFRGHGDVVGMTMASEATLACELGIGYASLCSVDNYCHGIAGRGLTYRQIVRQQKKNSGTLVAAIKAAVEMLS